MILNVPGNVGFRVLGLKPKQHPAVRGFGFMVVIRLQIEI